MFEGVTGAQWLDAGSKVLTSAIGGATQRPPETNISGVTSQPVISSWFDGAGWTVATNGSTATGGTVGAKGGTAGGAFADPFSDGSGALKGPLVLAVGLLAAVILWKKL